MQHPLKKSTGQHAYNAMRLNLSLLVILITFPAFVHAQSTGISLRKIIDPVFPRKDSILVQTIRGRVFEKETQQPLAGATVLIRNDNSIYAGAVSDLNGNFTFRKIPIGRITLIIKYVGYKEVVHSHMVDASRETVVEAPMEATPIYLPELKIHSVDDLAPVGANIINTDDLNRHAGNRGEAIRKVSVLPGIQSADDSRNDIIIRGNSPQSVLWRIEGVNIPNPNHFNIPGTSGGPVSMINDRMLASSAFYSGAFPAEFGNTTSGIFDLRFRNGDSTSHHVTAQVGLLGAELSAEGPMSLVKKSSYLFVIRRSTLGLFNALDVNLGTEAVPRYTDASFKINLPSKGGSVISLFGLGGISKIDILISQQKNPSQNLYGEKDRDQYFKTASGVVGITYKKNTTRNAFLTATVALSAESIISHHDFVDPPDIREALLAFHAHQPEIKYPPILDYDFGETRISGAVKYTQRLGKTSHLQTGISVDQYFFHYDDRSRQTNPESESFGDWRTRWKHNGSTVLAQPFVEWRHTANKFDVVAGLHHQFLSLNNSLSVAEPRVAMRYYVNERIKLNAGFGLHSQMQQPYLYFYGAANDMQGNPIPENRKMGFTRSRHFVAGVEKYVGSDTSGVRIKMEMYYQGIYDVPIHKNRESSFSLINTGADFTRLTPEELVNGGLARNYGIEITAERAFADGYLFLLTGSLFQSKFQGSDNVWRNTDFNCRYLANFLLTREWQLKKQNIIALGGKIITAGGRWYGPVDMDSTLVEKHVVYFSDTKNTLQFKPYFRVDVRFSYKVNLPRISHEIALDLINIFNRANVLKETYIPANNAHPSEIRDEYQLGALPFFYYRINF